MIWDHNPVLVNLTSTVGTRVERVRDTTDTLRYPVQTWSYGFILKQTLLRKKKEYFLSPVTIGILLRKKKKKKTDHPSEFLRRSRSTYCSVLPTVNR